MEYGTWSNIQGHRRNIYYVAVQPALIINLHKDLAAFALMHIQTAFGRVCDVMSVMQLNIMEHNRINLLGLPALKKSIIGKVLCITGPLLLLHHYTVWGEKCVLIGI